ncbi:MAG: hypothetical protein A2Z37_07775 [Chloroflexi bacterium RBG_19FT_COMBO_62_14]|nr:MAG: hypothetical protein A2Z37_07775 [Chloroflexi bacterium RBG_19FT_COMBO_62_14]
MTGEPQVEGQFGQIPVRQVSDPLDGLGQAEAHQGAMDGHPGRSAEHVGEVGRRVVRMTGQGLKRDALVEPPDQVQLHTFRQIRSLGVLRLRKRVPIVVIGMRPKKELPHESKGDLLNQKRISRMARGQSAEQRVVKGLFARGDPHRSHGENIWLRAVPAA